MSTSMPSRAAKTIVVAALAFVAGWFGMSGGKSLWRTPATERAERNQQEELKRAWTDLSSRNSRIDSGQGPPMIIEFGDYECPYCRVVEDAIGSLVTTGQLTGVFLHFPLVDIHPYALGAAKASICAEEQGFFRPMHRALMGTDSWRKDTNWVKIGVSVGVPDIPAFQVCLTNETTSARIERDIAVGRLLGVKGTPTFFSRTRAMFGAISPAAILALAQDEPEK